MADSPVTLCIPARLNDLMADYCKENKLKDIDFLNEVITEYSDDTSKITGAVQGRLTVGGVVNLGAIDRRSKRVSLQACSRLREIAKTTDIGFDSLTRLILADKFEKLGLLDMKKLRTGQDLIDGIDALAHKHRHSNSPRPSTLKDAA